MPLQRKTDSKGPYYQYGNNGAKYYYISKNPASRLVAKHSAIQQGIAVNYSLVSHGKYPEPL